MHNANGNSCCSVNSTLFTHVKRHVVNCYVSEKLLLYDAPSFIGMAEGLKETRTEDMPRSKKKKGKNQMDTFLTKP